MRNLSLFLFLMLFIWIIAACTPEAPATEEVAVSTEAPAEIAPTVVVRQPQGEELIFTSGTAVFTVPNLDGRWELLDMQGDRLVPVDETRHYNIRMSALHGTDDFEATVQSFAEGDEVIFSEAGGQTYAAVQRTYGVEYFVDHADTTLVVMMTILEGATVTAPERDAVLEAVLATTVDFIE